jgi:mannose-6-phosphate isomerase-like protein (cupin superfamily)
MVGSEIRAVRQFDLVSIPSMTWHQFRATNNEPLGFLCMVNVLRDRPQLPSEEEIAAMRANPRIEQFLED